MATLTLVEGANASVVFEAGDLADHQMKKLSSGLKTIRAVWKAIAHILSVPELLPEILANILDVYPDAARATALLKEEGSNELVSRATKCRDAKYEGDVSVSRTILELFNGIAEQCATALGVAQLHSDRARHRVVTIANAGHMAPIVRRSQPGDRAWPDWRDAERKLTPSVTRHTPKGWQALRDSGPARAR
jgi:hypothetical protein